MVTGGAESGVIPASFPQILWFINAVTPGAEVSFPAQP